LPLEEVDHGYILLNHMLCESVLKN